MIRVGPTSLVFGSMMSLISDQITGSSVPFGSFRMYRLVINYDITDVLDLNILFLFIRSTAFDMIGCSYGEIHYYHMFRK